MAYLMSRKVPPAMAAAMIENFQKVDQNSADIDKANADAEKASNETNKLVQGQISAMVSSVIQAGGNQEVLDWNLQHFGSYGTKYAAAAQDIRAKLAGMPPDQQMVFLKSLVQAPETINANAATATAAEKTVTSAREAANQTRAQGLSALAAAPNSAAYGAVWQKLDPATRASVPNPAQWNAQTPRLIQNIGMTNQEQVTTAQAAKRDAQTQANENAHLVIDRARLENEQNIADPSNDPNYLAGVVRGEIQLNPRDKHFAATTAAAKTLDPTFTSDRFSNAQHMHQSLTSGPLGKKLESFNQLTSHLGELSASSDALGHNLMQYTPGIVSNLSSAVKRYNDANSTAGAELASTLAQGQATQGEVNTATDNLKSGNPTARADGIRQYTKLIGGRLRAVAKQYSAATGDVFPVDQYVDSDAIRQLTKNGVNPYDIADQEKPTWMKAKITPVGGVAPAAAAPVASHGIPDVGGTFNGQKILKVTPLQ
jgi:hypothetical protein